MSSRQLDLWKKKQQKRKQQTVEGSSGSVSREWSMPEKDVVEDVDELMSTPPRDDTPNLTWRYRDKRVVVPAGRRDFADADGVVHMPEDKLGDMMTQMVLDDGVRGQDIRRKEDVGTRFGYVTRDTETGVEQVVLFKK